MKNLKALDDIYMWMNTDETVLYEDKTAIQRFQVLYDSLALINSSIHLLNLNLPFVFL